MTNKESLLSLLAPLEGKRAAAGGLKVLVEKGLIDDNAVMELLHMFLDIIYETNAKIDMEELKKRIIQK